MTRASIAALALVLVSCGVDGDTCGRGRCAHNTCRTIFADSTLKRNNQGWQEQHFPRVDNEWWCERDCPANKKCAGKCLQDPANSDSIVCSVDNVKVVFYSTGTSVLGGLANQTVTSFQIISLPSPKPCYVDPKNLLQTCTVRSDCDVGVMHSGDAIPAVHLADTQGKVLEYCPGDPDNQLGPSLPEGKTVRIYADQQ